MRIPSSKRWTGPSVRRWIPRLRPSLTALALGFPLLSASAARASETLTYGYDARGRLKTVAHSGTVNNGKTTTYTHDKADNRTAKTTAP